MVFLPFFATMTKTKIAATAMVIKEKKKYQAKLVLRLGVCRYLYSPLTCKNWGWISKNARLQLRLHLAPTKH
jgi:hypothetical protein